RMIDRGLDPQQAAEAPRVFAFRNKLRIEKTVAEPVAADLARRGHDVETMRVPLGGCQAIWMDHERGVLIGGSEPRKDGLALGYCAPTSSKWPTGSPILPTRSRAAGSPMCMRPGCQPRSRKPGVP